VGRWEGLTKDEVEQRFPDEIARLKAGEDLPLGGGESFAMFAARVDAALARVRASLAPGDHVLIVCHGGVIGTALSGLLGLRGSRRFPLARVSNTSISEVLLGGEREDDVVLRVFNDGRHVSAVAPWPAFEVKAGCVALFCAASQHAETDAGPPAGYGSFGAHYDTRHSLLEVAPEAPGEAPAGRLRQVMKTLLHRHPEQRVSVAAPAATIRSWAASALWSAELAAEADQPLAEQSSVQLELPSAGNLCHLGTWGESLVLHDYGVSLD
jgi:broad specificity phosphatase PhoE